MELDRSFKMQDTWESHVYRCAVCLSIFSGNSINNSATPFVVCDNIHSLCSTCANVISRQDTTKCPTCREPIKKILIPNRDMIEIISKLKLPCGSCTSAKYMTYTEAIEHTSECPDNLISCPMIIKNASGNVRCNSNLSISSFWKHCLEFHGNSNSSGKVPVIECDLQNGMYTCVFTTPISRNSDEFFPFTITDTTSTYNMALHVIQDAGTNGIIIYVRRFFTTDTITIKHIILSLECSPVSGLVVGLGSLFAPSDSVANIVSSEDAVAKVINIPNILLEQMSRNCDTPMVKTLFTIQLSFVKNT